MLHRRSTSRRFDPPRLVLAILAIALPLAVPGQDDPSPYEYRATRDLVKTVNQAAALFAREGEVAFEELSRPDSRWLSGEHYIFVFDEDGVCVFHPRHPSHVGKNMLAEKDVLGRPYHQWIVDIAKETAPGHGWVYYFSPPPDTLFPRWKSSYVVAVRGPGGERYALGSGLYDMRMERRFVEDLVDRAAKLIQRRGKAAFAALRDPAGAYSLPNTYVYVLSMTGELAVDPAFEPGKERNALDYRDSTGRLFIRDAIARLQTQESAWIMYMWPKPGDSIPARKLMYARRVSVDGETYLVGSDLYTSHPIWLGIY